MSVNIKDYDTNRFIAKLAYIGLVSPLSVLLTLIFSPLLGENLINKQIKVGSENPEIIKEFTLKPHLVGALRVDVKAFIPTNRWVTYEIQLLDEQGNLLGSTIKEAWRESGTWQEDGERGTWSEQDLQGGMDIKVNEERKVTLVLNVLGYGARNQEISDLITFRVNVQNGVIDTRHLWPGLFGSLILSLLGILSVPNIGKRVITKTVEDSDPTARETVGGANKLVRVDVNVLSDETTFLKQSMVTLVINNSYGEQIYKTSEWMDMNFKKTESGYVEEAKGKVQYFFLLNERNNYGFHVNVTPDAPVDKTTLKVTEGVRTRGQVKVVEISTN
ncbi:MAG: hypothetical protein QNJ64_04375 [Crocosphaera sp.]|nr:hypothetical protein [Crocosphaera sp.]